MPGIIDTCSVGYKGYLSVDGVALPIASSSLERGISILPDDNIHGSSNDNAASRINWAEGQNTYTGDITTNLYGYFWNTLKEWTVSNRIAGKDIILSPEGTNVYTYSTAKVTTLSLSSAEGNNLVGVTVGVLALGRTDAGSAPTYTVTGDANLNTTPTPYWKTSVSDASLTSFGIAAGTDVLSWDISITNNSIPIYVLNGEQDPKHTQQCLLEVTGSLTMFNPSGIAAPTDRTGSITISLETFGTISIPVAVLTGYPMPPAGVNAKITRTINFTGFAGDSAAAVALT